jgi:hypothetical protein
MSEQKFPDLPDPTEIPRKRFFSSVTYWWIGTILLLGLTIVWLPSQCASNSFPEIESDKDSVENLPQANQNKELEFRENGLWYKIGDESPYSGAALDFHENGKMKSRTRVVEGKAIGLIEEWDENGSVLGVLFKDEFPQ